MQPLNALAPIVRRDIAQTTSTLSSLEQLEKAESPIDSKHEDVIRTEPRELQLWKALTPIARKATSPARSTLPNLTQPENELSPMDSKHGKPASRIHSREAHAKKERAPIEQRAVSPDRSALHSFAHPANALSPMDSKLERFVRHKQDGERPGDAPSLGALLSELHGSPVSTALHRFAQPENALSPIDCRHSMSSRLTDTREQHPKNALLPMDARDERPESWTLVSLWHPLKALSQIEPTHGRFLREMDTREAHPLKELPKLRRDQRSHSSIVETQPANALLSMACRQGNMPRLNDTREVSQKAFSPIDCRLGMFAQRDASDEHPLKALAPIMRRDVRPERSALHNFAHPANALSPMDSKLGRFVRHKRDGGALLPESPVSTALHRFAQPENALSPIDCKHRISRRLTDTREQHPKKPLLPMDARDERPESWTLESLWHPLKALSQIESTHGRFLREIDTREVHPLKELPKLRRDQRSHSSIVETHPANALLSMACRQGNMPRLNDTREVSQKAFSPIDCRLGMFAQRDASDEHPLKALAPIMRRDVRPERSALHNFAHPANALSPMERRRGKLRQTDVRDVHPMNAFPPIVRSVGIR